MCIEHSTLVMITCGATVHKIFPGAHETSDDTLKAEGWTQENVAFVKENFVDDGIGWL